jgi:hypothetical protein
MGDNHPLAHRAAIRVADLAAGQMLFVDDARAPEVNQFVREMCRTAGFTPKAYSGTAQSVLGARVLLRTHRVLLCVPESCAPIQGLRWRPLIEPSSRFPWSLLWRAGAESEGVQAIRCCAEKIALRQGWMDHHTDAPSSAVAGCGS